MSFEEDWGRAALGEDLIQGFISRNPSPPPKNWNTVIVISRRKSLILGRMSGHQSGSPKKRMGYVTNNFKYSGNSSGFGDLPNIFSMFDVDLHTQHKYTIWSTKYFHVNKVFWFKDSPRSIVFIYPNKDCTRTQRMLKTGQN